MIHVHRIKLRSAGLENTWVPLKAGHTLKDKTGFGFGQLGVMVFENYAAFSADIN